MVQDAQVAPRPARHPRYGALVFLALLLLAALLLRHWATRTPPYHPPPESFAGDSADLQHTVVIPTLDTPLPADKNAVWCSAFELAWSRLRRDVVHDAVRLAGAAEVCARLNQSPVSESDLAPESYFAYAGFVRDGAVAKIRDAMSARFPEVQLPPLDAPADNIIMYAYLGANVKFTLPYFDRPRGLRFKNARGEETLVSAFSNIPADGIPPDALAKQIRVLYTRREDTPPGTQLAEYAIDPCRDSQPYQVVLAVVPRAETLAATLAALEEKLAAPQEEYFSADFDLLDVLLIPNMHWTITHKFAELAGADRTVENPALAGYWLAEALEMVQFRLDRSGAQIAAQAKGKFACIPRAFVFDRPFLIYLKKRDAAQPFFVMWVENAELLSKLPQG